MLDVYNMVWTGSPLVPPTIEFPAETRQDHLGSAVDTLPPRVFGPCIEKTCVLYICRMLDMPVDEHQLNVYSSMAALKQKYSDQVANQVVADLAEIAVRLMCSLSGMSEYVYGVVSPTHTQALRIIILSNTLVAKGASEVMEYVLRWRISPTVANRLAIPEPFRPTPLQYSKTNYSLSIDMINWPTLRDQLILYSDESNIDEIVYDVVLNTVIEIPQMQISLNVLDLFQSRILPKLSEEELMSSKPYDLLRPIRHIPIQKLNQHIWHTINSKMGESTRLLLQEIPVGASRQTRQPKFRRPQLSSQYGLDRLSEWRLSIEFCEKYPFLECSSCKLSTASSADEGFFGLPLAVAASFPMISCANLGAQ